MAEVLAIPMKKASEVDLTKPLRNLISSTYSNADQPEDYGPAIAELQKMRTSATCRTVDKHESSLELLFKYHDQLAALENKIPPSELQIPFKWKDAFDKGSIFGGKISLTVSSLAYERVCVLFNIAALQSQIASVQSLDNDENLKLAAKLLQQAGGIFAHLKSCVMSAIQQDPTPDLNPDSLSALSVLMLAQAQEIFIHKAIQDRMKDQLVAKLCAQGEELFADALKQMQRETLRPLWDRDWLPLVAGKQAAYHGLAEYHQSLVCSAAKNVGEQLARLQHALDLFRVAQQRAVNPGFFQDYVSKAQRAFNEAKKDNDFIYHERIPDIKTLSPVEKSAAARLAKFIPVGERLSVGFKDLFENLVPVVVHQALAAYDVRKTEIVQKEITTLRESTQLMNSVLASLNLPAALEDSSSDTLPPSVLEKASAVRAAGGLPELRRMIDDLPQLLERNREILDESERLLKDERDSDNQLRAQFKDRWTRTESEKLTETFQTNAGKYRQIVNNAISADGIVRSKFEKHLRGMDLLSKSETELVSAVPAANPSAFLQNSPVVQQLKARMEEVETLKAERDAIECELKSATVDMSSTFLNALAQDGAINESAISVESLGQVFGPLQKQVKESVQKQERLMENIQTLNNEFTKEKSGSGGATQQREELLKELAASHDAFMELQANVKEGTKFYNDLTQLLVTFQNKISDFCFARKTEKDELMKDLTQNLAHAPVTNAPTPPSHHTEARREPPARPPPPSIPSSTAPAAPVAAQATGTLPYPTQPQGMPMPYGPPQGTPYPVYTPMPQGYNPYAYMPPGQGGYPYPYPQQQPGYPAYPGYPQQPQQPPRWP